MENKLSILWFPDCTLWEVELAEKMAKALGRFGEVNLVRVGSANLPQKESLSDTVWVLSHHWKAALRQAKRLLKGKKVFVSALSLPSEKGSLFTLLWRRTKASNPHRAHLIAHSPINHRFFQEIDRWNEQRLSLMPFGSVSPVRKSKSTLSETPCVIGTCARFLPESNLNFVLSVAHYVLQKRPDTLFRIFGSGPLYGHLMRSVRELGLESRVEIIETELTSLLESVDVMLYPPTRNDHFLPVFQAAELGCPVVAVDLPGINQLLIDGKTGFVVPQYDTKSMGELVIRLVDHPALREAIGVELFRWLSGKYTPEKLAEDYSRLFWSVKTPARREEAA